jgi:hypothetical protein
VCLPPQYGGARYSRALFPVVELLHGSPGTPLSWSSVLHISQVADSLLTRHLIGPMILVMPPIDGNGHDYQDCVNGPGVSDETYLTKDVRADVFAHHRVSHDSYEWGVAVSVGSCGGPGRAVSACPGQPPHPTSRNAFRCWQS